MGLAYLPAAHPETVLHPMNRPVFQRLVQQSLADLPEQSVWERMEGEYRTLGLYPEGHIMAHLRPQLGKGFTTSEQVAKLEDGRIVKVAGLVVRRQRPYTKSGVVFVTLEDEFGHIPLMIFPQTYERYQNRFKAPFLMIEGKVSRRDGTQNVVVTKVKSFNALDKSPAAKNWG